MSVTPTPYDELQDTRITAVEEPLRNAAEPPIGDEYSYPVVQRAMSSDMWQWMHRGQGDGILFAGIKPYWLGGLNNASNTVQIMVSPQDESSHAIIAGYFHTLAATKTLSIPMPSAVTTYTICLTYDPRRESDADGPIRLEVHTGEPPTTFGRKHIILWRITRRSNELLTDAVVERVRPGISPVIAVNRKAHLPAANEVLNGTLVVTTLDRGLWVTRATNDDELENEWIDLQAPVWYELFANNFEGWGTAQTPHSARSGSEVTLRGLVRRVSRENFTPREGGWWVYTLPPEHRPNKQMDMVSITSGESSPGFCRVSITTAGGVHVFPSRTCAWVGLDGIKFFVE